MHATPEHTFRDSLMILHLLRDDIILWSAEMQPDGMCLLFCFLLLSYTSPFFVEALADSDMTTEKM